MLLVDQVELLRQNFKQLRNQEISLPLISGGLPATRKTYYFKFLVHPARDIATTIHNADPSGNILPPHRRSWNLSVKDEYGRVESIHLKKLLGMIIHVYYLHIAGGSLDISNDLGKRAIVQYDLFLNAVERLLLSPEDICLVVCNLAEKRLKNGNTMQAMEASVPGSGDLQHLLFTISNWPLLKEKIWIKFFVNKSKCTHPNNFFTNRIETVDGNCEIMEDTPFMSGSHYSRTTTMWKMGWRRGNVYATAWIDASDLIYEIRDNFDNSK